VRFWSANLLGRHSAPGVAGLLALAAALEAAMQEMDRAETANPRRIARDVIAASRFFSTRH
jgi:hypothetical protein